MNIVFSISSTPNGNGLSKFAFYLQLSVSKLIHNDFEIVKLLVNQQVTVLFSVVVSFRFVPLSERVRACVRVSFFVYISTMNI